MKKMYKLLLSAFALLPVGVSAQSAFSGDVDSTFANTGSQVYADSPSVSEMVYDKVIDKQAGKMYLIGMAQTQAGVCGYVRRINADGSPDNLYGTNSMVFLNPTGGNDLIMGADMQPDGKLVLCGSANNDLLLYRLNPDGSADVSFNSKGLVIAGKPNFIEIARDVIVDNKGRIVIAGSRNPNNAPMDFFAARFKPDGTLDSSFGITGSIVINTGSSEMYSKIIQLNSGHYLCAGSFDDVAVLSEFKEAGMPDSSFGINGARALAFGANFTFVTVNAVTELKNGNILFAGTARHKDDGDNAYAYQVHADGSDDNAFGTGGVFIAAYDGVSKDTISACNDILVLQDETILLSGDYRINKRHDFMVIKLQKNGVPDNQFGVRGMRIYHTDDTQQEANALMVQDNAGAVFLVGNAASLITNKTDLLLVKLKQAPTHVLDISSLESVNVYPNPCVNELNIYNVMASGMRVCSIMNIDGRTVMQIEKQLMVNGEIKLNTSILSPGLYVIALSTNEGMEYVRFVKQ